MASWRESIQEGLAPFVEALRNSGDLARTSPLTVEGGWDYPPRSGAGARIGLTPEFEAQLRAGTAPTQQSARAELTPEQELLLGAANAAAMRSGVPARPASRGVGPIAAIEARKNATPDPNSLEARQLAFLQQVTDLRRQAAEQQEYDAQRLPTGTRAADYKAFLEQEGKIKHTPKSGWDLYLGGLARGPAWQAGSDPMAGVRAGMQQYQNEAKTDFEKAQASRAANFLKLAGFKDADLVQDSARTAAANAAYLLKKFGVDIGALEGQSKLAAESAKNALEERKARADETRAKASMISAGHQGKSSDPLGAWRAINAEIDTLKKQGGDPAKIKSLEAMLKQPKPEGWKYNDDELKRYESYLVEAIGDKPQGARILTEFRKQVGADVSPQQAYRAAMNYIDPPKPAGK